MESIKHLSVSEYHYCYCTSKFHLKWQICKYKFRDLKTLCQKKFCLLSIKDHPTRMSLENMSLIITIIFLKHRNGFYLLSNVVKAIKAFKIFIKIYSHNSINGTDNYRTQDFNEQCNYTILISCNDQNEA